MGFINISDKEEVPYSCVFPSQQYNFTSGFTTVALTTVPTSMGWITTGYSSGPTLSAQTGKSFRSFNLTIGVQTLNLNTPMSNNTYCAPTGNSLGLPTVSSPIVSDSMLLFNPDASSYPL